MMRDDMALVREYAQSNSEQAFATLVSRHINLVYSVALRQVGDSHLAEEIAQGVFIILTKKAKSLGPKTIISGWLCRMARYVSAHARRDQRRRQFREQEAHMESILNEPEPGVWNQIAPLLDEALNCLGEKEHDAVVLRFFDGKELKQVGAAMGTTEDAARMRVNRGVEKLRNFFTKRGVTLSAAAITGAVAANSVQAAPAGLAAAITAAALSGTTITTTAVLAATKAIAMTTLQKALVVVTVVAASLATPLVIHHQSAAVTIIGAHRLANSGLVRLDIRNDAPGRVRLYAVDLLARVGTNWVFVGQVPLGYTNSTERSISIEVSFPDRPRPWKAELEYMPAFSRLKLLRCQLSEAWKAKSVSQGFRLTQGWEGERHACSPEIAE
jgi:RNA polymerase sigma factor (sigma-70 family)